MLVYTLKVIELLKETEKTIRAKYGIEEQGMQKNRRTKNELSESLFFFLAK